MSKLVLITGPQAVGKMTVGQELTKITNLKLIRNYGLKMMKEKKFVIKHYQMSMKK